ncbi:hypothetical protein LQ567_01860 [Niabella pedocola]|uniref:Uncharacterized protein n=1 Tax=Niabella pedocola TaxID=1752077 RepID=A0ABS8PL70_9BACT|nr:hypothetical protein [Niabella pedocola]MCD2421489.1 hypothetical protein [Niabella pedocola]
MRTILTLLFIVSLTACSKSRDINPESLKGTYQGQQQFVTTAYILIYPINLDISLDGTLWSAAAKTTSSGTASFISGNYRIEKDSVKFTNHRPIQDAPVLLNTNYKVTVRGDSLYLSRVINGIGEIYSLKRTQFSAQGPVVCYY